MVPATRSVPQKSSLLPGCGASPDHIAYRWSPMPSLCRTTWHRTWPIAHVAARTRSWLGWVKPEAPTCETPAGPAAAERAAMRHARLTPAAA